MCLLDSVSLGKPFVSTNIGGARELSNNQRCGLIVETDEHAALAICSLLNTNKEQIEHDCQKSILGKLPSNNCKYILALEASFCSMNFSLLFEFPEIVFVAIPPKCIICNDG